MSIDERRNQLDAVSNEKSRQGDVLNVTCRIQVGVAFQSAQIHFALSNEKTHDGEPIRFDGDANENVADVVGETTSLKKKARRSRVADATRGDERGPRRRRRRFDRRVVVL